VGADPEEPLHGPELARLLGFAALEAPEGALTDTGREG
jgi:hypothetical protein